jgi:hypothetical protein
LKAERLGGNTRDGCERKGMDEGKIELNEWQKHKDLKTRAGAYVRGSGDARKCGSGARTAAAGEQTQATSEKNIVIF